MNIVTPAQPGSTCPLDTDAINRRGAAKRARIQALIPTDIDGHLYAVGGGVIRPRGSSSLAEVIGFKREDSWAEIIEWAKTAVVGDRWESRGSYSVGVASGAAKDVVKRIG